MKGTVDSIHNHAIRGWCFDRKKPLEPPIISVFIDGKELASQRADRFRYDLEKKVHPTGYCGFCIPLPPNLTYQGQPIVVRANGKEMKTRFVVLLGEKGMEEINRIQLYGERASGTNYLRQLLVKNIPNIPHTNQYGWKHFFPPDSFPGSDRCLFLVIYRDPFDWIRSLHLQPHHVHPSLKNLTFSTFIRTEWHCVWDELANVFPGDEKYGTEMLFERNPKSGKRFDNVLQLRSAKIRAFESLRGKVRQIEYIRYEDLVADPIKFLNMLARKYRLHPIGTFENITTYKGITENVFKPRTYKEFSADDLKFLLLNLDVSLEKRIGYSSSFSGKLMSPLILRLEKMKYWGKQLFRKIIKILPNEKKSGNLFF